MTNLRHWASSLIVIAALAPTVAAAQTGTGLNGTYISVSGLYVSPVDSDVSGDLGDGLSFEGDLKMDAGFGFLVAFGYGSEVGLRGEVELGFRNTDIDKLDGASVKFDGLSFSLDDAADELEDVEKFDLSVGGDVSTLSLMLNGIYAFEASRLRPYFGVGIGLARHDATLETGVEFDYTDVDGQDSEEASLRDSDDDIVLAYQAMAGIAYPVSETMEARIGYRYFATADADFDGVEASYGTHNLEAGILVRF